MTSRLISIINQSKKVIFNNATTTLKSINSGISSNIKSSINSINKSSVLSGSNGFNNGAKRSYSYAPPSWEIEDRKNLNNHVTSYSEEARTKEDIQGLLWVNNLYPIKVSRLDLRSLFFHIPITTRLNSMFPDDIEILSIEKRIKEGGAYIYFNFKDPLFKKENEVDSTKLDVKVPEIPIHDLEGTHVDKSNIPSTDEQSKELSVTTLNEENNSNSIVNQTNNLGVDVVGEDITDISEFDMVKHREQMLLQAVSRLEKIFEIDNKHFHFASRPARCMLVQGKPFIDDMDLKLPSNTLKVTLKGADVSIDELYRHFRPYGKIGDIYVSSKDSKQIYIIFHRMEGAIAARNCLHQKYLTEFGTTLYIEYEMLLRINKIKEQFSKHPKIMIPLIGLLFTLITILLINPLREYFVNKKLESSYSFDEIDEWQTREEEKKLLSHFNFPPNSIVMICAPKGSGKSSLIDKILQDRENTLLIDCNQDVNNSDEEFVENFSKAIGFFPSFGVYSNLSGVFDAIIPTGKSAFHSSTSYQIQTILKILDDCLNKKALHFPIDPHEPFTYPLVVIDGFFGMISGMENKDKANIVMDSIIQWAITTTQRGNSHVVFISSDPFGQDILKKYLDNRGGGQINSIQLTDVSAASTKAYVKNRVGGAKTKTFISDNEMDEIVNILGGRYYDLNLFSQRLVSGESVNKALFSMIQKAVAEIRGEGFGLSKRSETQKERKEAQSQGTDKRWTRPQLWETIKRINSLTFVSYDDLLFNVFLGDETSLNNLITAGILRFQSIESERMVTAYSPLYCAAFKEMVNDVEFNVGMDILVQKSRIEEELSKLSKVEDELLKIKHINSQNWFESQAVKKRRILLEEKMKEHVSKIESRENILKSHQQFIKLQNKK